jgi:RNA polymerase sigma-70 factor (ECF subfamily)
MNDDMVDGPIKGMITVKRGGGVDFDAAAVLEQAYRLHAAELIAFATGLVGRNDAEDVVSRAMSKALGSPGWRQVTNRRAYLYRVVLNEARRFQRSAVLRRHNEWRLAISASVEQRLPRPDIATAVSRLSVQQRAVILLTYWEDLDIPAAAERLGITAGSVKRHLARARSKLREVLDE